MDNNLKRKLNGESGEQEQAGSKPTQTKSETSTAIDCHTTTFKFKPSEISSGSLSVPPIEDANEFGPSVGWRFYIKWNHNFTMLGVFLRVEVEQAMSEPSEKRAKTFVPPLEASFDVNILDPNNPKGDWKFSCERKDFRSSSTGTWGILNMISKDHLTNFVGQDGKVTFKFELMLVRPNDTGTPALTEKNKIAILENDSKELFLNSIFESLRQDDYSDLTLKTTDGQTFKVHKVVLGGRSEHFRNILQERREQKIIMPMERLDIGPEVLEVNKPSRVMRPILCHIYNGHLLPDWINPGNVSLDEAKAIVEACKEFGLEHLQYYYENFYPGFAPK